MTQLRSYLLLCAYYDFDPFPCHRETLCDYLCFLSQSCEYESRKELSIRIKDLSRLLGHDMSVFENNDIRLTLHGLTKIFNHTAKSKWPLTVSDLRKMITLLDVSQPLEACMWVFLTFFFFLLC